MISPVLESKSLMLAPICDGDQIAAAILDYVYLYFQRPSPYKLFFESIQRENKDIITDDFYNYELKGSLAPFNLDSECYPDGWLSMTLKELHDAIRFQFAWGSDLSTEMLLEGLKLLQNKEYITIEDWDLFEQGIDGGLHSQYRGTSSPMITCWLHRHRIDFAVANYYNDHLVIPPIDERIDIKREKRIVNSQVHRAKRIGQAASLTFDEWVETLNYFSLRCAFCQHMPYEILEHFIPIIHGGSSSVYNCVPACEMCNAIKIDRLPTEFARDLGEDRIAILEYYLEQRRQKWLQQRKKN